MSGAKLDDGQMRGAGMVGVKLHKTMMEGADVKDVLDDKPRGRPLAELGVPVEEAFRLYRLWVETGGRPGRLFDFSRIDLRGIGPRPGLVLIGDRKRTRLNSNN